MASVDRQLRLLVVEDDENDAYLLQQAVQELGATCELKRIDRGDRALAFLTAASLMDGPPTAVLLDLGLPGVDGEELLDAIQRDQRLHGVPVVVWTGSRDPKLEARVRELGVRAFHAKPESLEGYEAVAASLLRIAGIDASDRPDEGPRAGGKN